MRDGARLKYFLADHLGLVLTVTDVSSTLISQQRYLLFGAVHEGVGTITQTDFGYTFQRDLGSEVGLMDYRARFYSPYLNRFTQPDSIVPRPGDPQSLNRYSYVRNDPIMRIDPSGNSDYRDRMNRLRRAYGDKIWKERRNIYHRVGEDAFSSCSDYDYCILFNGARLDWGHFREGYDDWKAVLHAYNNHKKMVWIENLFGVKPFPLKFSIEGISSVDELREAFINWYAKEYQPKFEGFQYTEGGIEGKRSAFNAEDIPSMVLGATMHSYFDGASPETLYKLTINLLGGGTGENGPKYPLVQGNCLQNPTACDSNSPRSMTAMLKVKGDDGTYTYLPYPGSSEGRFGLDILNDLY